MLVHCGPMNTTVNTGCYNRAFVNYPPDHWFMKDSNIVLNGTMVTRLVFGYASINIPWANDVGLRVT